MVGELLKREERAGWWTPSCRWSPAASSDGRVHDTCDGNEKRDKVTRPWPRRALIMLTSSTASSSWTTSITNATTARTCSWRLGHYRRDTARLKRNRLMNIADNRSMSIVTWSRIRADLRSWESRVHGQPARKSDDTSQLFGICHCWVERQCAALGETAKYDSLGRNTSADLIVDHPVDLMGRLLDAVLVLAAANFQAPDVEPRWHLEAEIQRHGDRRGGRAVKLHEWRSTKAKLADNAKSG